MTTFQFTPPPRGPFVFAPVLDGAARRAVVSWNIFRGGGTGGFGWYVSVYTLTGTRVFTVPLTASADPIAVASAAWDNLRSRIQVATVAPHGFVVGSAVIVTLAGFTPATFNLVAAPAVVLDRTDARGAAGRRSRCGDHLRHRRLPGQPGGELLRVDVGVPGVVEQL